MVQTLVFFQNVVGIKQMRINNTMQKTSGNKNNKAKTPLNAILLTVTQGCINNKKSCLQKHTNNFDIIDTSLK
jgi:hypothetical protein